MKIPPAHMFPTSSGSLQSLVELLAAALAENELQAQLLDELRQENAALKQAMLVLQDRLNRDSTNSNQPPSQDSPFQKPQTPSASADPEFKGSAPAAARAPCKTPPFFLWCGLFGRFFSQSASPSLPVERVWAGLSLHLRALSPPETSFFSSFSRSSNLRTQ